MFSVFFLVVCAGAWVMLVGNPFDGMFSSPTNMPASIDVNHKARLAPKVVPAPKLNINNTAKPDTELSKFKIYLDKTVVKDPKLAKGDKAAYKIYVNKIDQYVDNKNQTAADMQKLQQLSEEYRIKTLQSQVLEQEAKISASKSSIAQDQIKSSQALGVPAAQQNIQMNVDHVAMVYSDHGKLQANIMVNGIEYNGEGVGDVLANTSYKITGIQANQVTLADVKSHRTKIITLQ
jgi:hypothetical protein